MTKREKERTEAIDHLRKLIQPGDTVYTVLRHVSRSGMTRGIDVYFIPSTTNGDKPEPVWITAYVGKAIDQPQPYEYWRKSMGLKIGGCGMDMGFHVVENLSWALYGYGEGYPCLGKGKCPSNYHSNHRLHLDGPERFDLMHTDGYALRHKWL
jgi:hypothetical protein